MKGVSQKVSKDLARLPPSSSQNGAKRLQAPRGNEQDQEPGGGALYLPAIMARMSPGTCPDPTSVGGVGGGRPWEGAVGTSFVPAVQNPSVPLAFLAGNSDDADGGARERKGGGDDVGTFARPGPVCRPRAASGRPGECTCCWRPSAAFSRSPGPGTPHNATRCARAEES